MNNKYLQCLDYLHKEGITRHFDIPPPVKEDVFLPFDKTNETPYHPEAEDLCRLHQLIRKRKVFTVLEFGIGYSTLVIADALKKNKADFYALDSRPEIRIRKPFMVYSIDANQYWIERFMQQYGVGDADFEYKDHIELSYSSCSIGDFNGQICHYYDMLPNIVPDFIYLDGPNNDDVTGDINGIHFHDCAERTVMGGDLLRMESCFLPGTMILIDGRTNNARFLMNNFKRNFSYVFDKEGDVSIFELCEPPLGKINEAQLAYCLGENYLERFKNK